MASRRPEELCPGGDRASVVAKKRGNARGVKGGRKVETLNESAKENSTVNVQWTQFGEEQKQVREPSTLVQSLLAAPVTGDNDRTNLEVQENASANLLASNRQLESRMQEICQSGSEGGAKSYFVPTPMMERGSVPEGTVRSPCHFHRCLSSKLSSCPFEKTLGTLVQSSRWDGATFLMIPGTSCLATISLSLRDKSHSPFEATHTISALMG